jgi:hypothetical protein
MSMAGLTQQWIGQSDGRESAEDPLLTTLMLYFRKAGPFALCTGE